MKYKITLLTLNVILFMTTVSFARNNNSSVSDASSIETYATDKAAKSYIVMGKVSTKSNSDEECLKKLKRKASKIEGNAVLNIINAPTGTVSAWSGATLIRCEGIIVRWSKEGEKGQSSIKPTDPMPYLAE